MNINVYTRINNSNNTNDFNDTNNTNDTNNIIYNNDTLSINNKTYTFKRIFSNHSNLETYNRIMHDLSINQKNNINSFTILVYGQTGSGKTYTLLNDNNTNNNNIIDNKTNNNNIIDNNTNTINDFTENIFTECNDGILFIFLYNLSHYFTDIKYLSLSMYEIYLDDIYDLLNERCKCNLYSCNDELIIQNLSKRTFYKVSDIVEKIKNSLLSRKTRETSCNKKSSRSHLIIQIEVKYNVNRNADNNFNTDNTDINTYTFVDLAGSERLKRNNRENIKESISINKGLLSIGSVINALYSVNSNINNINNTNNIHNTVKYIPWRGSKLTRILKHVLINNLIFIGCIKINNIEDRKEAINTLSYTERLFNVK